MTVLQMVVVIVVSLTAYTDCDPGMRCDGITASGIKTFDGVMACGPSYPLGTRFYVPALGRIFTCLDRGNLVTDDILDIWMADRREALEFGRWEAEAIVLPQNDLGRANDKLSNGSSNRGLRR